MRANWRGAIALCLGNTTAMGCAGGGEGPGYILLDREARTAEVQLRVDGRPAGHALPLEISDPGARVELVTPSGSSPVDVPPGVLVWVRGGRAKAEPLTIGVDVRTEAVWIDADGAWIDTFASALGAGAQREEGLWRLEGPDALVRSAWMGDPPQVLEARPVRIDQATPRPSAATGLLAALATPPGVTRAQVVEPGSAAAEPTGDSRLAALVGLYRSGPRGRVLLLDAEGSFQAEDDCHVVTEGRYRVQGTRLVLEPSGQIFEMSTDGRLVGGNLIFSQGGGR